MRSALSITTLLVAQLALSSSASAGKSGGNWYRCNTHTHTSDRPNSDANRSADYAAGWYKAHGYQCLVITDHEYLTDVAPLNSKYGADGKFLAIAGQEITQQIDNPARSSLAGRRHAHVNGIGLREEIMPVGHPDIPAGIPFIETYRQNIAAVEAQGGIAQVNHPNLLWSVKPDDLLPIDTSYLLEIWNAFPTSNNLGGENEEGDRGLSTEELWDRLLTAGRKVWGVASDDVHDYDAWDNPQAPLPGKGWIVVNAPELSRDEILNALRQGRFYSSTGIVIKDYEANAKGLHLRLQQLPEWSGNLSPSARYITRFTGEGGKVLAEVKGMEPKYDFNGTEIYVRATVTDSDGRRAWTQPVFRKQRRELAVAQVHAEPRR